MDRFLFNVFVDYPKKDKEIEIARTVTAGLFDEIKSVVSGDEILEYQALIKRAPVADHVLESWVQFKPHGRAPISQLCAQLAETRH